MPRPRLCRRIWHEPCVRYFKPSGIWRRELCISTVTLDELESVRLKDVEGLEQKQAADKMSISQPTFHRLLLSARKKIADAVVNGKAIRIEGGNFAFGDALASGIIGRAGESGRAGMPGGAGRAGMPGGAGRTGMPGGAGRAGMPGGAGRAGRSTGAAADVADAAGADGRRGSRSDGAFGFCVCPSCGYTEEKQQGVPCAGRRCKRCGSIMTRRKA
ncbi:DUF134 domain-containing protein [Candidatus Woesearchaeota archaeon]|nr:DUF134 domain-containing protein [Candidatus Woesearchaeota archaeon]